VPTSHHTPHTTHHTPHTSHHTPHTTHHTPHTSHLTPHTPHFTPHTSHLTPHTPHLTPHTPHFTLHTTHHTLLTPHTSHLIPHKHSLLLPFSTRLLWSFTAHDLSCRSIFTRALGESPNAAAAAFVSPFFVAMMSKTWATNSGNCGLLGWICPLLPGNFISTSGGVSRTFNASAICMRCSA